MSTPAADRTGTARCTDISHSRFRALLVAGLLIRLAALPLEGTEDVLVWKTWSYAALNQGLSRMYGVGGQPPERGLVRWGERVTTVDYPPIALYELAAAGAVYRAFSPSFENNRWLNVAIKVPCFLPRLRWHGCCCVSLATATGNPRGCGQRPRTGRIQP